MTFPTHISLFHKKELDFMLEHVDRVSLSDYQMVLMWTPADCESVTDALEELYGHTQNLDEPWNAKQPCRSTSVGDVMCVMRPNVPTEYYLVSPFGFTQVEAVLQ